MLKFFRRIRQKLLAESSLRKYLVYASGEIFLVVIGILIALQVNNWNEEKQKRAERLEVLKMVVADIEADLPQVDNLIQSLEKRIAVIDSVVNQQIPLERLQECFGCLTANLFQNSLTFSTRGNDLLKNTFSQQGAHTDTLVLEIVSFYESIENQWDQIDQLIKDDIYNTLVFQRDHIENTDHLKKYYKFSDTGEMTKEVGQSILSSKDFMRRMMFHQTMLKLNPLPVLKQFKRRALVIKAKIEESMEKQ